MPRPVWQEGTAWSVVVHARDLREEVTGVPDLPPAPEPPDVPGYPPLVRGAPRGYRLANTFRFEVTGTEEVRYPEDQQEGVTAPEVFWLVRLRPTEGRQDSAVLHVARDDLTLARIDTFRHPGADPETTLLSGAAILDCEASRTIGFPLDWPDFSVEEGRAATIDVPGRPAVREEVRSEGDLIAVTMRQVEAQGERGGDGDRGGRGDRDGGRDPDRDASGAASGYEVTMRFRDGAPFWLSLTSPLWHAELVQRQ